MLFIGKQGKRAAHILQYRRLMAAGQIIMKTSLQNATY
jgi:hypothetical protein